MTTNWQPSGNKILVKMDQVETTTKSGIIISAPGTLNERAEMAQMDGTVVALGPLAYFDQPKAWLKVGDRVKITKFGGWLHSEGEDKYRVIHDLDVIMVLKGANDE
jgi:co-chaperonin GroES (HSP10)